MKTQQSGFTLIEIAIVLVIIGLILGGVLKGQELITSAKSATSQTILTAFPRLTIPIRIVIAPCPAMIPMPGAPRADGHRAKAVTAILFSWEISTPPSRETLPPLRRQTFFGSTCA